ncbi:A/G-specific adenine glycosylase [Burkholderia gladioli]|uniref:Adenine DNA glycosylase n=1 Tax=Burkholderia gladioli (strain BSR3) TaxID=999541 RepID=F2LD09_BURGS|nr:A/G-specific adenine glycosylase [Burkholderia gladioli]AEA62096.1 A/G-specific adenine glycosylase MutY [Burkholderia gladioli BSR3]MBW5282369.1 A/G-specific adenine glycosylase [Burkholderia gladioli]NHH82123.1 Adenine DNA glycosylase [Burkholderia gladioli]CAG9232183.1 Adenine DNA glycosylase [Burkholderia gladioli]
MKPPRTQAAPAAPATPLEASFATRLIAWQREHGRHDLPWQNTRDPYRIWLSEIMLQQTQVSTVVPYYQRFLEHFPDVAALAAAPADQVMALWAGLGYYTRARNLHRCAQVVMAEHGGHFPESPEALAELPGIGRSTAAAISSFAFGARAPILDGNVKRVLARVFGVEGFPGEKRVENGMWALAERLFPREADDAGISAYTQGLMDLGATLCGRGKPDCKRCPFAADCVANTTGRQRELPAARPKKAVPTRRTWMLVLRDGDTVLLERRPPTGIWGGLWSLPEADGDAAALQRVREFGAEAVIPLAPFTHVFTHFRLEIEPRIADIGAAQAAGGMLVAASADTEWVPLARLDAYGLPAPVRKLLDSLSGPLI